MISFFVFGCNPKGCNSDQLKLITVYDIGAEVCVDDVDGDEKCLWVEFVFQMDIDEPIEKDHSHVLCDIRLALEIVEVLGWFAN